MFWNHCATWPLMVILGWRVERWGLWMPLYSPTRYPSSNLVNQHDLLRGNEYNAGIVRIGKVTDEEDFVIWWRVSQVTSQASPTSPRVARVARVAQFAQFAHPRPPRPPHPSAHGESWHDQTSPDLTMELQGTTFRLLTFDVHPSNIWAGLAQ